MLEEDELEELKSRLREEFSDYYELAGGKDFRYFHLVSAHNYARKLMETEEVQELDFDPVVVEVAALFHDIGRSEDIEDGYLDPFENHPGHDERGEEMVREFVEDFVTEEQMQKIEQVIGNHHSQPETAEGKIVQDADELFKFGVHDLWRMFHYASEKERTLPESIEYFHEELKDDAKEKMSHLHFDRSKEVAEKREKEREQVINEIQMELDGDDI